MPATIEKHRKNEVRSFCGSLYSKNHKIKFFFCLTFFHTDKMVDDPFQMPPIVEFTAESTREKEWDNIAAIHSGLVQATTWSFGKCKMGELHLVPEKYQNKNRTDFNVEATCISLTHCGNFVIIGECVCV